MSAAEIIEMIEKVPPAERAIAYARKAAVISEEKSVRYLSNERLAEVAPKVSEKHRELLRRLAQ